MPNPGTQQNQVVQSKKSLFDICARDTVQSEFRKIAPAFLKPETFFSLFRLATTRNPKLLQCTEGSIIDGMMQAAKLGLEISGLNNQGALVPFYSSKLRAFEAVFIPGYQGLIGLVYKSGMVKSFDANAIYENDFFEQEYGTEARLTHRPTLDGRGSMIGAYAIAKTVTGGQVFKASGMGELAKMQQRFGTYKDGNKVKDSPWWTDPEAMLCKTMVKRTCKFLDLSPDNDIACRLREAIHYDNSLFSDRPEPKTIAVEDGQTKTQSLTARLISKQDQEPEEPRETLVVKPSPDPITDDLPGDISEEEKADILAQEKKEGFGGVVEEAQDMFEKPK
jgi:recombination protein RecT